MCGVYCQMLSSSSLVKLIVFEIPQSGQTNKNFKTTGELLTEAAHMRHRLARQYAKI